MEQAKQQVQELTSEQLELVTGGEAAICIYADKAYSEGAIVSMPGGNKTCSKDGTWK